MQLKIRFSLLASQLLVASSLMAEDYVSVQYMRYDEDSGRTTVSTPSIEISKDFGVDYNLKLSYAHDALSGASPTWYDSSSGATTTIADGTHYKDDIVYGDIPYEDTRNSLGATFTTRFASRDELTLGFNYSGENDYTSREASAEYLHYLDSSKNRSLSFGLSFQKNDITVFCDKQECDTSSGASANISEEDITVLSTELGFTQIIDATSLVKASVFYIGEDGYLSNPYMNVVRDYDTSLKLILEKKPDTRAAYGALVQYSKSFVDALSAHISYRFYHDDWKITSHTINTEFYYELQKRLTLGVGVRYYLQSEAYFYNASKDYFTDEKYASSDRRMSAFDSYNLMFSAKYDVRDDLSINGSVNAYSQPKYFDSLYYNIGFIYKF